jgi:hypothetical protein
MAKKEIEENLSPKQLAKLFEGDVNDVSFKAFSLYAYMFCHEIENFGDYNTYGLFLKNVSLDDLMKTEQSFIDDCENVFNRQIWKNQFGEFINMNCSIFQKKKICKDIIKTFYEELTSSKRKDIQREVQRLGL